MEYRSDCLLWFWMMKMVSMSSRIVLLNGIYVFTNIAMEFRFSIRIIRLDAPRIKINGSYVASRRISNIIVQYEYELC